MDSVEREVYVEARPEQVWTALTRPEHFATWYAFGGADIDLRPGGQLVMRWEEHGEYRGFVEKLEPGRRFAYRYAVDPDVDPAPGNSNLVEFTLTPEGEGTRLRVVESGFDRLDLPADVRAKQAEDAANGWDVGLEGLAAVARNL
ncbi:SRPBCC domain-containing protein [Kribbella sp. VKM Ac-2568]|uniref:SRPBCC domain-containing protein n=1 Tax=Kribbella sp. VKM Ac-2568 TaxID=2512219 RepID=UPI001049A7FD|nr:SRPBCC domain-containing protein [Kribbella sp. VKM Ac-2568]TCM43681.1 uncharacterized protein YndB with AHSA1/START domain [Kribbella sp. VKM Ac-2568]